MEDIKFAVLIDADNTSAAYVKTIFDELANEGRATVKRIYGDWTSNNLVGWKNILLNYAISPVQQYSYTVGKNSTDSALIIDAMDILYTGEVDGFCLVSSDSDFTKLAIRLREAGKTVIGMGRQQTPQPFIAACGKFKYLDVLSATASPAQKAPVAAKPAAKKDNEKQNTEQPKPEKTPEHTEDAVAEQEDKTVAPADIAPPADPAPMDNNDALRNEIADIISNGSDEDGTVLASHIGGILQKIHPDFDSRNYGYKKMTELLEALGFTLIRRQDPNNKKNPNGVLVYVKVKD